MPSRRSSKPAVSDDDANHAIASLQRETARLTEAVDRLEQEREQSRQALENLGMELKSYRRLLSVMARQQFDQVEISRFSEEEKQNCEPIDQLISDIEKRLRA